MKKLISIILTLALLAGCIAVMPAFAADATTVYPDYPADEDVTIFDTTEFNVVKDNVTWQTANPAISTEVDSEQKWLSTTSFIGGSSKMGLFMQAANVSAPILAYNGVETTRVSDFEWQTDIVSGNGEAALKGYISFMFHINENSTYTTTSRNKLLAVTLMGSNYTDKYQKGTSLLLEYTTANGMRPLDYDSAGVPKTNSYIDMTDFVNGTNFKAMTLNIKLNYNCITVTVWETGKKDTTTKTLAARITWPAYANYGTDKGDFAILNGYKSGSTTYGCNFRFCNMSIKAPGEKNLLNTEKATAKNYTWWGSNTVYTKNTSTGVWSSSGRGAEFKANADSVRLNQHGVADRLLAHNQNLPEGGVENFVWEFDFTPGRNWGGRTSFAFHVSDDSVTTGVVTKDESETVTGYTNPLDARKNLLCVTICTGNADTTVRNGFLRNGIVLERTVQLGNNLVMRPLSYDNKNLTDGVWTITKGVHTFDSSFTEGLLANNLLDTETPETVKYYRVRIMYFNNYVYVYMWDKNDPSTMISLVEKLTDSFTANAGDFSIINSANYAYFDNMTITSLDYEGAEDVVEYYKTVDSLYNLGDTITREDDDALTAATTSFGKLTDASKTLLGVSDKLVADRATITALTKAAHDINDDTVIDICDLVKLDLGVKGTEVLAADKDPVLDGKLDAADLIQLRGWILNLIA
ncbi:MAG: hypothetical protein J6B93_05160 [Clostridia bacterium]|nr:hypothetical protein [Clostridia bacterium]